MPSFKASKAGKAYRCGHAFNSGEIVYYESGVSGYICKECATHYVALQQELAGVQQSIEATLNNGIPLAEGKPLYTSTYSTREQAIAAMHQEKMLVLQSIATYVRTLAEAEQERNAYLKEKGGSK